jgi:hypothetical protein
MPHHQFLNTLQCPTAIQTTLREKMSCALAAISSFGGPDAIGISKVNNAILVPQKRQKRKLTDVLVALTQVLHHSGYLSAGLVHCVKSCSLPLLLTKMAHTDALLAKSPNTAVAATLSVDKNTSEILEDPIPRSKLVPNVERMQCFV